MAALGSARNRTGQQEYNAKHPAPLQAARRSSRGSVPVPGASRIRTSRPMSSPTRLWSVEVSLHRHPMKCFPLGPGVIHKQRNLADTLGIYSSGEKLVDRPTNVESTSGRANITLPFNHNSRVIDATWQSSSGSTSHGHRNIHSVRNPFKAG